MIKILFENARIIFKSIKTSPKRIVLVPMAAVMILAALLLLSAVEVPQQPEGPVFNEVVSDNSRSAGNGMAGSPDWVELYNASGSDFDLTGYRLTDSMDKPGFIFDGVTVPQNGYLVIYASKNAATGVTNAIFADFGISEKGETLYLLSPQNRVACELKLPALGTDVSYARRDDATYGFCIDATPGARNTGAIYGEDAIQGALEKGDIVVSEVMPKAAGGCAWAELYNKGDTDISLGGYYITDDGGDTRKWRVKDETLKAGGYAVVYFSGEDESAEGLRAPFTLGSHDTGVYLYDNDGNLVSSLKWDAGIPQGVSVTGDYTYSAHPTKGEQNSQQAFSEAEFKPMDSGDPVRINEVLPANRYGIADSDGQRCEWAEIRNASDRSVPLAGYYLSDSEGNLLKWAFPDIEIGPQEYIVVFLSGKESKQGELHASFRLSGKEGLYLTDINAMKTDALALSQELRPDASVGRDENGAVRYYSQPTPAGANGVGAFSPADTESFDEQGLYISEVCAAERAKANDNDWIELHNGSNGSIDITGYFLSDDIKDLKKWAMPSMSIQAGGYAVVEASAGATKPETACFGISPEGETIFLSDKEGTLIDAFDTGVLKTGVTSGRIEGNAGLERAFFDAATRGAKNADVYYTGYAQTPELSETELYHKEAFALEITCATPGADIYYTTDGSVPTKDSILYTAPVSVSQNTPVRAVAYAGGCLPSEIATATFIFDAQHTLPVFCLTGNQSDINEVLKTDTDRKPEYPVYVEYFETDGTEGVSFPSGLSPKGKASLRLSQNSLKLSLRSDYGRKSVIYPFFGDGGITEYTTLSLRSGGQDSVSTKLRDSFFQAVFAGMDVDGIMAKPVVVYANGQYCGLYDLNEEQNDGYITSHYGVEGNNIDMVKTKGDVLSGDSKEYERICRMARSWDLSDDSVFAQFAKYVDIDACTDYLIAQIYFGNGDVVNQRFWRARDYSVKWRPLLFDLDFCLRFNDADRNVFRKYLTANPIIGGYDMEGNDLTVEMYIFCALKKNAAWREKFVERFIELSVTQFRTERILGIYDDMAAKIEPEMEQNIERWHTPRSMAVWNSEKDKLRDALEKRQGLALKQLQDFFNVPDETIQKYMQKYAQNTNF